MATASGDGITVTYTNDINGITVTRIDVNETWIKSNELDELLNQPYIYVGNMFDITGRYRSENISLTRTTESYIFTRLTGTWTGNIKYRTVDSSETIQVGCNYHHLILDTGVSVEIKPSFPWKKITVQTNTGEDNRIKIDGKAALTVTNTLAVAEGTPGYSYHIRVEIGAQYLDGGTDTTSRRSYIIPISALEHGTATGSCTIALYYNDELLTSSSCSWYMEPAPGVADIENVALRVEPVSDVVPAEWQGYVVNMSRPHVEAGASIAYGALTYKSSIDGEELEGPSADFSTVTAAGQHVCALTVTDSWGRTAQTEQAFTVWDYAVPEILSIRAYRCTPEGGDDEQGTSIYASAEATWADCGGHNVPVLTVERKPSAEAAYGPPLPVPVDGHLVIEDGAPDVDKSYDVRFTLRDAFNIVFFYSTVLTGNYFMHFKRGGKGVAVGKAADQDGLFDVGWNLRVRRDTEFDGELTMHLPDGRSVTMTEILQAIGLLGG